MAWHIVQQGEHLPEIARKYGFGKHSVILDHPENQKLRDDKRDPHLLLPGDRVFIPEHRKTAVEVQAEKRHQFVVEVPKLMLRVFLHDENDKPLGFKPFTVTIGGRKVDGTTGRDGLVEVPIPINAHDGKLEIDGHKFEIRIGFLDPINSITGTQSRLMNLGYTIQEEFGALGPATRDALSRFQETEGLEVTGQPNDQTLSKLQEKHRC